MATCDATATATAYKKHHSILSKFVEIVAKSFVEILSATVCVFVMDSVMTNTPAHTQSI